ncbi:MAG TPA: hypothetical protein VF469_41670 [Kofleriaceae bacterium]
MLDEAMLDEAMPAPGRGPARELTVTAASVSELHGGVPASVPSGPAPGTRRGRGAAIAVALVVLAAALAAWLTGSLAHP